jgi:hypothetical protein
MCRTETYQTHFSKCGHTSIIEHVYRCPAEQRNMKKKKNEKKEKCTTSGNPKIYSSTKDSQCSACNTKSVQQTAAMNEKMREENFAYEQYEISSRDDSYDNRESENRYYDQLYQAESDYQNELAGIESDHSRNLRSLKEKHYHNTK